MKKATAVRMSVQIGRGRGVDKTAAIGDPPFISVPAAT
jgi:hypothetical protein